jgi:hypothetical protein
MSGKSICATERVRTVRKSAPLRTLQLLAAAE